MSSPHGGAYEVIFIMEIIICLAILTITLGYGVYERYREKEMIGCGLCFGFAVGVPTVPALYFQYMAATALFIG